MATLTGPVARRIAPLVASGRVPCASCGELIKSGEPWHLDHDDLDQSKYLGVSHVHYNCRTSAHRVERKVSLEW
jgi:hypothetical protein